MSPRLRLSSVPYAFDAGQVLCTRLTWYYDGDGDGYGDPDTLYQSCEAPPNYVTNSDDCDDTDPALSPETPWYADADEDTFGDLAVAQMACGQPEGYVDNSLDCNDLDADINPDATEVCDGLDNNCDAQTDEIEDLMQQATRSCKDRVARVRPSHSREPCLLRRTMRLLLIGLPRIL